MRETLLTTGIVGLVALWLTPELTTALAVLVGALGLIAKDLYVARTARIVATIEIKRAIEPVNAKMDTMKPVVDKIEAHVNSDKTKDQGIIAARDQEIKLLHAQVEDMRRAAALLAQAKATADVAGGVAQAAVAGATTPIVVGNRRKEDTKEQ